MAAILDIGTEEFSNSESPCHPDASHQVSALTCGLGGDAFEEFQDAAILDTGKERF